MHKELESKSVSLNQSREELSSKYEGTEKTQQARLTRDPAEILHGSTQSSKLSQPNLTVSEGESLPFRGVWGKQFTEDEMRANLKLVEGRRNPLSYEQGMENYVPTSSTETVDILKQSQEGVSEGVTESSIISGSYTVLGTALTGTVLVILTIVALDIALNRSTKVNYFYKFLTNKVRFKKGQSRHADKSTYLK